jgi:cytochrome P450
VSAKLVNDRQRPGPPSLADLAMLADPVVIADPYPLLARFREASPFAELDGALVVVGRYEDCSRILRDPRVSSMRERSLLIPPEVADRERTRSFLSLDPPDHTRLRRLVAQAFTPRVVATLAPRITEITHDLLSAAADRGELELVSKLAYPLPVRIISELLGVPPEDHARFAGWSAKLAHSVQPSFGTPDPVELAEAEQAALEFANYFTELIAVRRSSPADDLLTKLIKAEDAGDRLTVDELIATCVLLLVAGHETTVGLISNAVLALLRNPDQLAALSADPELAAGAVEETLRYDPRSSSRRGLPGAWSRSGAGNRVMARSCCSCCPRLAAIQRSSPILNSELVLVRNPYFDVWNPQAQPAGYPDKIIEKFGETVSDEVTAVESGQADEVFDGDTIPADRLSELNSPQYAKQVHVNRLTADYYMALNTKLPPFNNVKARQAINYAADRVRPRQGIRRPVAGDPDLPDPAAQLPGLQAVLPVHRRIGSLQVDCRSGRCT